MVAGFDPKVARGIEAQLAKLDELLELIGDAPEDAERFAELGRFAEARWVRAGSAEPATGSVASGLFFGGDAFRKLRPAIPRASAPPGRFGSSSRRSAA